MAVRLVLQKPAGTDIAFLEASNANAARVIAGFVTWAAGSSPQGADTRIRQWLGLPDHVEGDPLLDVAGLSETDLAVSYLAAIKSYTVKKAGQVEQEGKYAGKLVEADAEIAADPVEWV